MRKVKNPCQPEGKKTVNALLPKDPATAAALLAALLEKDKDETVCKYPTCHGLRQAPGTTGRRSAYCEDPEHTALTNHRARATLRARAASTGETMTKNNSTLPQVGDALSLRASVLSGIAGLQQNLERYMTLLAEIADPDIANAQQAAREATAQQAVATERSLRLAAESASQAAKNELQSEREAVEQAIERLEAAEARIIAIEEETTLKIDQMQKDQSETIEQIRAEAQAKINEVEKQASEALALANTATTKAQEETRQAEALAAKAQAQANTAERLIQETQTALERERGEVDRLRGELTATIDQARKREESERAEALKALERERAEIDRLRKELTTTHTRADQLAILNDELRTQLQQAATRIQTEGHRTGGTS